jgi:hypothetical protein
MPAEPVTVNQPEYPLHALTTYELRDYRRQLEHAIGYYQDSHPAAPALGGLRQSLDEVTAEQESRARISNG